METKKINQKLLLSSEKLLELDDNLKHIKTLNINESHIFRPLEVQYVDGELKFNEYIIHTNNHKNNNINNITSHALNLLFPLSDEQQKKLLSDNNLRKFV